MKKKKRIHIRMFCGSKEIRNEVKKFVREKKIGNFCYSPTVEYFLTSDRGSTPIRRSDALITIKQEESEKLIELIKLMAFLGLEWHYMGNVHE